MLSYAGDVQRDTIGFGEILQKILNNQFANAIMPLLRLIRKRITYIARHFNLTCFNLAEANLQNDDPDDDEGLTDFKEHPITADFWKLKRDFKRIHNDHLKDSVNKTMAAVKNDAKKTFQMLKGLKLMEIQSKEVSQYSVVILIQTQIQFTRLLDQFSQMVVREISNGFKFKLTFGLRLKTV